MTSGAARSDSVDRRFMRRALKLAARGVGATRPNPPVGAVIVKNGRVIGDGWHRAAGQAHAEVLALQDAGQQARGATLYVSLEPCCTTGRTGACTERIVESGIRRVVVASLDPNPAHAGRGLDILRQHGLIVEQGCEREQGETLLAPFARWITTGRPWVTLKLAMSVDGKIGDRTGRSRWISSEPARARVQALRRSADAILIGAQTARLDRPTLLPAAGDRRPWRVIVDSRGQIDPAAPVFCDPFCEQTILATTKACPSDLRKRLEQIGVRVWSLPSRTKQVSARSLMQRLGRLGVLHVLCEGGGELAASLVDAELVNEYHLFIAPRLLGGRQAPGALGGVGFRLQDAPALEFLTVQRVGPDLYIRARPQPTTTSVKQCP